MGTAVAGTTIALGEVLASLVDRLGWPGAIFVVAWQFVERNATKAQKEALIDAYFLGKGVSLDLRLLVVVALFTIALLGQHIVWKRRLRLESEEVQRLAKWKSDQQQKQIGVPLHHSAPSSE